MASSRSPLWSLHAAAYPLDVPAMLGLDTVQYNKVRRLCQSTNGLQLAAAAIVSVKVVGAEWRSQTLRLLGRDLESTG